MPENETTVKTEETLTPDQIEQVNAIIQALQFEVNKLTSEKIQVQASLTVTTAKLKEYQDRENKEGVTPPAGATMLMTPDST